MSIWQLQDISEALAPSDNQELKWLVERFGLEQAATMEIDMDGDFDGNLYEILKYVDVEKRREIIQYLINQNTPLHVDILEPVQKALQASELDLDRDDDGEYELVQTVSEPAQEEKETHQSYIEKHAPLRTVAFLKRARKRQGQGEFSAALFDARNAIEKLLPSADLRFAEALDEMGSNDVDLIETHQQHDDDYVYDLRLLNSVYQYCSSIGAHPEEVDSGTPLQAAIGLVMAEQAIYFLVKKGEEAEQEGIDLEKWDFQRLDP